MLVLSNIQRNGLRSDVVIHLESVFRALLVSTACNGPLPAVGGIGRGGNLKLIVYEVAEVRVDYLMGQRQFEDRSCSRWRNFLHREHGPV